ncbi:MAG TPA: hypothetical protein VD906_01875 [Caulobacteraceae bacterium]|nr:hypothetical protein [Caulobacteraceae bacterium]
MDPQAELDRVNRTLVAHDFLLRALLTHLALSDPRAFESLIQGFVHSRLHQASGEAGELTREIAQDLTRMVEEIAASVG